MAGVTDSKTFDALATTTLDNFRNILVDNIFDDYPFLSWLNGKLGKALRGDTVKRMVDGGHRIAEQLLYEVNSTSGSYDGYEQLDVTPQEGLTVAFYNWKQYSTSISISGKERRQNTGSKTRLLNLLEAKTKQATMTMRKDLSEGAFSDGTGNGSKDLTGLQALVSSTTTVGGLAPGTYSWWAADETTTLGSFASLGLNQMRVTFNNITFGNDRPDFVIMDQATFEYYEKALQPQERYTNTQAANSGFTTLTFKGIPVIFDRDCPSGTIYMLNSRYINFVVHPDADFMTTPFVKPENQDATVAQILFMGNLTVNNRRMHGTISGITA